VRLPSISQLRAFEASARHLSFTSAGRELSLTQAAISLRVQNLEEIFGAKLFHRGKVLMLTQVGQQYLQVARDVLNRLETGTSRVLNDSTHSLRILVTQAVASLWLIPRLNNFSEQNPSIKISILNLIGPSTLITPDDFTSNHADVAIVNSPSAIDWPGLIVDEIVRDYSVPVCSPALAAAEPPECINIERHTLIHTERWPQAWPQWLEASATPNLKPKAELWFNHTGLSTQAAMSSLGWTIAHGPLVAEDILSGRLAAPLRSFLPNEFSYFFLTRPDGQSRSPVTLFREWFSTEIRRPLDKLRARGFDVPSVSRAPVLGRRKNVAARHSTRQR
jgi:LysR family transcriptional regulator, glycine cleavage system transcriptional activator